MRSNSPSRNQPRTSSERMIEYRIIDAQQGGLVVSTFGQPSQWRAGSQVIWNREDTYLPARVFAAAFNPNGVERCEFLAPQFFFWLGTDFGTVPIGHSQHGLVRMPLEPAADALVKLVTRNFRGNCQNLRVTGVYPVTDLWKIFNDPPPQQGESLRVCVEYDERGRTIEEEFYGTYDWNQTPGGGTVQTTWGFARLFCFRAERGKLDGMRETFWQIAASLQLNPQWKQLYDQIVQDLNGRFQARIDDYWSNVLPGQIEAVKRNVVQNAQFIQRSNDHVNAIIEQTRREIGERSRTHRTPQEQVGDLLGEQTLFHDPNSTPGNPHVMHGHARYVWTDNGGNFHYTDDPMDNPNHHKDKPGHWVPATPL